MPYQRIFKLSEIYLQSLFYVQMCSLMHTWLSYNILFKKSSDDLKRLRPLNKQISNSTNTFVQVPVCIVHDHDVLTKDLKLSLLRRNIQKL